MCNFPNYSTFCYSLVFSTSNQFTIISNTSISSSASGIIKPIHTSTPERKTQKKKKQEDSNPKTIRVLNVNFQSIRNTHSELINLIESTKPDIIVGTETWLDSSIKDSQYFPDGFNIYRNDRNLSGGGVPIAVNDTYITSSVTELQTDCEIAWCKMEIVGHKTVYLSSYYNPKTSNEKGYNEYGISIERASKIRNAFIISAGDFNLPGWDWTTKEIKMHTQCVTYHEKFADILDDNGMAQLVTKPTRGLNTLDLVVTNHPESFMRVETLPGLSDHEIVFTEVNLNPRKSIQKPRIIPLYRKANWENMKLDLNKLHQDITLMNEQKAGVNKLWTHFQTKLEESIGNNVPKKTARKKDSSPWITSDIKRLIRKRDRWFKRMKT
ncbi:uncharacterized protein [Mytilus edulis]|uniref:uncharacterized protein n=1 Tax=Mytilus edulis TaxID=6550 RepID=UPI0039EE3DFB